MRNVIMGGLGVLWGGGILLYALLSDSPRAGGAYGAGRTAGTVLGFLLFVAGAVYLVLGIMNLMQQRTPRPRPRKRKRRRVEDDED
jgi:hypothetical protein